MPLHFLCDDGNRYTVDDTERINDHKRWRLLGMVETWPWGRRKATLHPDAIRQRTPWEWSDLRFHTGRPRFRIWAQLKGVPRIWSQGIVRIWRD